MLEGHELYAIIVAGGKGLRMQTELPKQFIPVAGKPILMHTIERFQKTVPQARLIVVLPREHLAYWQNLIHQYNFTVPHHLVEGGEERFHSVRNGLSVIDSDEGLVAIHDGVRPFVATNVIIASYREAALYGNAIASVRPKDSVRWLENDHNNKPLDRNKCRLIQTPQTFRLKLIRQAFSHPYHPRFTDDASVLEETGEVIHLIEGNYENIKITTVEDLKIAEVFATSEL
ncbi:MAG: 2-C-methyl-D-erythritol 4-phosphate cytidylyltransferase [Flammeovirgaceae bacterium]|nr:2-C-methyl-D-erythritol 4-phosphate cytidylyltransferase [Flammeovirgaceae bacterium]MDW8286588.1 2-C-methyl-D-erythritol 4-phosphate cytidylyltransferase [Flammeovirgaceae bacterium]